MTKKRENLELEQSFSIDDLDIEEWHVKYAKNNYFKFYRGIEYLGMGRTTYGAYRFHPRQHFFDNETGVVDLVPFDMLTIANFLREKNKDVK